MKATFSLLICIGLISCSQNTSKHKSSKKHYSLSQMSLKDLQFENYKYGDLLSNGFDSVVEWKSERRNDIGHHKIFFPEFSRSFDKNGNLIKGQEIMSWGSRVNKYDSLNLLAESDITNAIDTVKFRYTFNGDSLTLYRYAHSFFMPKSELLDAVFKFNEKGRLVYLQDNYKRTALKYNVNDWLVNYADSFINASGDNPSKCVTTLYYTSNHLDSSVGIYSFSHSEKKEKVTVYFDKKGLVEFNADNNGEFTRVTKYAYFKRSKNKPSHISKRVVF